MTDVAKPKAGVRPTLIVGDSVYYRHKDHGVTHGVVGAVGEHGFTSDSDSGDEHKVLWADFLGHRKRAGRALKVVDQGEDGSIVEDEAGQRMFVRGGIKEGDY